ncbi:fimbria/pilus periplasmic chaperone [Salmonella enterica subsp. enterica serovar Okatie]|uniref:fimbria/pilus periplasmic chaperone n=1 Tax=Salmonella enterica TaxID=28901 RepID=UPI0003BCCE7C|nr:fimbria/pilus periplasmic chaperone [Salmonella enterica]EAA5957945.1 long polar fimbrial chaperone LpfB [Salmonella enterica subsp. enterica serovar Stanleyville]EBF8299040.1 long polar fimbrial chaperone LpfB [Salmonella enterica subsp. enterica serovar Mbandaka]EBH9638356.1 long polar fimbrial chaperone LpfB [Salmonella enterica subsp. enterica serovar Okatie]EDT6045408.1 fimbria/pilus periplasmic chaperone [Salmonella enterica subsp. enterica serovar Newyork]HBJ6741169.1 fimbria/pilus p
MNSLVKAGLLCSVLCCSLAQAAGINIGATRVIFHSDAKDETISISNSDTVPYLIQSWAQSISDAGVTGDAPFMVTPPLFRLNGGQKNVLRIIRTGGNLPEDRESLYWLDIKSIPSSNPDDKHSMLKLAVKAEFKLIYRPKALAQTPEKVTDQLTWSRQGNTITVKNPTPYYMNFAAVSVGSQKVKAPRYVAPFSSANYPLPTAASGQITWSIINDFGGTGPVHKQTP